MSDIRLLIHLLSLSGPLPHPHHPRGPPHPYPHPGHYPPPSHRPPHHHHHHHMQNWVSVLRPRVTGRARNIPLQREQLILSLKSLLGIATFSIYTMRSFIHVHMLYPPPPYMPRHVYYMLHHPRSHVTSKRLRVRVVAANISER